MINWKGFGRKRPLRNFTYLGICLYGLRKTNKILCWKRPVTARSGHVHTEF